MTPAPITAEMIRKTSWHLVMHAKYVKGGYGYTYQSGDFPELTLKKYKPSRDQAERRGLFVGEERVPWGDLERAAELLNARRRAGIAA